MCEVDCSGCCGSTTSAENGGPVQIGPPTSPPKQAATSGVAPNATAATNRAIRGEVNIRASPSFGGDRGERGAASYVTRDGGPSAIVSRRGSARTLTDVRRPAF